MFLREPPENDAARAAYEADRAADGYVTNHTRLWSWRPDLDEAFRRLRLGMMSSSALTERDFAVLVTATASQRGDSYCSLAWGRRLAGLTDAETAARVLGGDSPEGLSPREAALADWARKVVPDPNATTERDVARLREAGLEDPEIFEATAFVAFRLAFSTVNDALGAAPDEERNVARRRSAYERECSRARRSSIVSASSGALSGR
ncbi:MAG TPA: hypothetical protein VGQ15_04120 [Gaiellaceae bacterium]|nr:hypothetical protein [Gaiellaceae bacterium]